jgi:hypothetical protein
MTSNRLPLWIKFILGGLGFWLLSATLATPPVWSAERINLSISILSRSIPVQSLANYANTGKMDADLAAYAKYVDPKQIEHLQELLRTPVPLDAVVVSQFLYSPMGEELLKRLGEIIQTDAHLSGFYALRAALILAATDPKGLTLLNVLRYYPSDGIWIDLTRALKAIKAPHSLFSQTLPEQP